MALKETIQTLRKQIEDLHHDLEKASTGVKAAAQRVRIGTIRLAKVAKIYRKESLASEKGKLKPKLPPLKGVKKGKPAEQPKRATAKLPTKK